MKRWICMMVIGAMLLCCTGCGNTPNSSAPAVVATIFPGYDLARQIANGRVGVTMLLPPGGEVHGYEPSLAELALVQQCDVFIYNGGDGDRWVEDLLASCDTSRITVIRMMDHVELLAAGEEHHQQHHQHTHDEADEHIWTTPANGAAIAKVIYEGMKSRLPEYEESFDRGYHSLKEQLTDLEQGYEVLRKDALPTLVVADRFPFLYLAHEYGLDYIAAFSGCSSNTEATLSSVAALMEQARESRSSKVILHTEFSDRVLANTVAQGVGGTTALLHSCHNVTKEEWNSGVTYTGLLEQNLTVLKEVFGL